MKMILAKQFREGISTHRRAMTGRVRYKIAHICDSAMLRKRLCIYLFSERQ